MSDLLLIGPGDGEQVSQRVRLLADLEEIAVTESLYAPGDSGPGPHIHNHHADTFWVLGGELVFELGREAQRFQAPAGTFIGAPPGLVHTFRDEGPEDARFLNFHAPGCSFGRYLRDLVADRDTSWFDTADPPDDGGAPATGAIYVPPGDGERNRNSTTKARRKELTAEEITLEPGAALALPARFVAPLEGTLTTEAGDCTPGTYLLAQQGSNASISNDGPRQATLLIVST